jgi:histidine triad (HIT) family protein
MNCSHFLGENVHVSDCVFCDIVSDAVRADVVYRDPHCVAFLDRSPVFKGHVLVVPVDHVVTLADLAADELGPFFAVVQRVSAVVPLALGADGTFVAMNNTVSQSVPHLHAHVVPRRRKDGLRGFFWPRVRYADDADRAEHASRLRALLRND